MKFHHLRCEVDKNQTTTSQRHEVGVDMNDRLEDIILAKKTLNC